MDVHRVEASEEIDCISCVIKAILHHPRLEISYFLSF